MSKRITIGDIARATNVHKATVSRALNDRTQGLVSPETVRRVRRAAQELGYVPNAMARGLRTSLSMTIGVILPDLTNPIFPPIVRGIESSLQPRGYTALIANTDGHDAIEMTVFDSLIQRQVDGLILATGRLDDQPVLEAAERAGVPVVMVNREGASPLPLVTGDNAAGVEAAVRHLVELGHTHIVHLAGPVEFSTTRNRADAFEREIAVTPGVTGLVVHTGALSIEAGERAINEFLAREDEPPTAVLAGNDLVALGVLRSLRAHGLRCPQDVSVVGFNDMPFAEDFAPALTTVRMPLFELGAEAARLLLTGIDSGRHDPVVVTFPVTLVVRRSTGRVPRRTGSPSTAKARA